MFVCMNIREAHHIFLNELSRIYSKAESANITQMIFETFAGITRSDLIKNPSQLFSNEVWSSMQQCLSRLKAHEPVQYIIGHAWFYKLKFNVTPAVLIPRPETEELVYEAISFLMEIQHPTVLDIGTGSGCIPIALKKNLPSAIITSVDISSDALNIASENAAHNEVAVMFRETDFLSEKNWNEFEQYDAIISNPPYIPESEKNMMDDHVVKYEPSLALFVKDNDPLIFYKKIADFARRHLKKNGKVFLETHQHYANEVCEIFIQERFDAVVKKDIHENDRMVFVSRCR